MSKTSDKQQQLVATLKELFMMDQADLDFGIYRIMNAKHTEIESFLNNDLLPTIRDTLQAGGKVSDKQKELDALVKTLQDAGMNPDESPKVIELKALLGDGATNSLEKDESEIFSQLTTFFSRYYDGGDFMSLRRYKQETYSPLPMNGEEVKLHWANADQYYIKSAESFSHYAFKVGAGDEDENKKTIRFELVQASTEQNNKKEASDKERRFILDENQPISNRQVDGKEELILHFNYQVDSEKRNQKNINLATIDFIHEFEEDGIKDWKSWQDELLALKPTDKNKKRTVLEKYLMDYTAKNSFDYFIHKDLGGFLKRELNFFIKNELLLLDDIVPDNADSLDSQLLSNERTLKKMVAFKAIAQKLIAFLAQLENFQKKLWLKKKFVLESNYCMTLDRVPDAFYEEIAGNQEQVQEWVGLGFTTKDTKITKGYLEENPFLLVDTGLFNEDFKQRLLAGIEDLDETTDGLLIHSENFQALNLMQERYREQVKCICIDPPYNTGSDGFAYKDNYQHSSWLSMFTDRLSLSNKYMQDEGVLFVNIDDNEVSNLNYLISSGLPDFSKKTICIKMAEPTGPKMASVVNNGSIAKLKEYVITAKKGGINNYNLEKVNKSKWDDEYKTIISGVSSSDISTLKGLKSDHELAEDKMDDLLSKMTFSSISEYSKKNNIKIDDKWKYDNAYRIIQIVSLAGGAKKIADDKRAKNSGTAFSIITPQKKVYFIKNDYNPKVEKPRVKILFADDYLTVHPGDFWADIKTTGLDNEGHVDFHNGKKPKKLISRLIKSVISDSCYVVDYFAGSGTTGEVCFELSKSLFFKVKPVLVEQSEYFDTKLMVRQKKSLNKLEFSSSFKYIRLESYEDVVDNLQLQRTEQQTDLLNNPKNQALKEDYLLNYMLDIEARGSLFNRDLFTDPFNAKIRVVRDNESREQALDLVETFNYLLGLRVESTRKQQGIVEVIGTNPADESVHIIWRNLNDTDNDLLDEWFRKQSYNTRDMEFDRVYVNGDNNLPNLKTSEESWKVQLIEEVFETLMFDCQDV